MKKKSVGEQKPQGVIFIKKPVAILFLVVFFLLLIMVLGDFFAEVFEVIYKGKPVCGDGTFYDTCSLTKPYFCNDGELVERVSICGCPIDFNKQGDLCTSKYHMDPKNISLNYFFKGSEGKIDFVVYEGMADFVSDLPRTILYHGSEKPSRVDFKLKHIDEEEQRKFLMPLVIEIQNLAKDKEDQMRIAVSLIQNIPFGQSNKTISVSKNMSVDYARYAYEVLYDQKGICGEKSELLAFMLREIGYGVVIFYNSLENHESVGIKCPVQHSLRDSGYCFVETSGPAIISDDELEYVGGLRLISNPEIMLISDGISLGKNLEEYEDAEKFKEIRNSLKEKGKLTNEETDLYEELKEKYGLVEVYEF